MKDRILVVDDIEINRIILREILTPGYEVEEAADGIEAVEKVFNAEIPFDAVLLDIMMPGMDGFEVLNRIRTNPCSEAIPVLFITAADANENETRGLKQGAMDYISKPFNPDVVKARVDNHIQLSRYRNQLEQMVEHKTAQLRKTHERMLVSMATIIEYRSLESGEHVKRVGELTRAIITRMLSVEPFQKQLLQLDYNSIVKAVPLHDIGKVGIPDSILLKPGRLTDEEYAVIKTHSIIGSEIIQTIADGLDDDAMYLKHCEDICRHHHERWDGTGYPDGLKGEEIPLSARIVSVVDVYDALVNNRCYKDAFSHDRAVALIVEGKGTQFDARIVDVMLTIQDKFKEIEEQMQDPE